MCLCGKKKGSDEPEYLMVGIFCCYIQRITMVELEIIIICGCFLIFKGRYWRHRLAKSLSNSLKTWLTPLSTIRRDVKDEYMKLAFNLSGALTASSFRTKAWGLHDASSCQGDSGLRSRSWRLSDSSTCASLLSSRQSSKSFNVDLRCKIKGFDIFITVYA